MPTPEAPSLYRIEAFPELFADACLRGGEGRLKFLSFYGRDGSAQQFLAALQLGVQEGGITRFTLLGKDGQRHLVDAGNGAELSKFSTRLPRQNLFGPLSQIWLYEGAFAQPDRLHRIGWVLHRALPGEDALAVRQALLDRAWAMTGQLAPVALLHAWRQPLQDWCLQSRSYELLDDPLYPPLGGIAAMRVSITDHFLRQVSEGVRERALPV